MITKETAATPGTAPVRIVIAQRGWVWIGRVARDGDDIVISPALNVRRWGTSAGLGQLAAGGPREYTQLDPSPAVRLHHLAVIAQIDADEETWAARLS